MRIGIFESPAEVAVAAAEHLIAELSAADEPKVLGVATGSTPEPMYDVLSERHAAGEFSLEGIPAFALDEYVGIDPDHPERYRNVLIRNLVGPHRTGLREEDLHSPDGSNPDPHAAAAEYDAAIKAAGGISLQILGIGADGHIAFNEPGVSLKSRTHVDVLTPQTRRDNARFFDGDIDNVPSLCLTQGIGTIMEAKSILLLATGTAKREAVRKFIESSISARWPASALQNHPRVTVMIDEAAAAGLELTDFYRLRWETL